MRDRFSLILGCLVLFAPGCAAIWATSEAAKVAGKTTVAVVKETTKVVTWPIRAAMNDKRRKTHELEPAPAMVVSHAATIQGKPKKALEGIDGDVVLTGAIGDDHEATPEEEEPPVPRKARKRQATKPPEDVKLADVDEVDKDAESEPESDPEPEPAPKPRKKPAGWKSRPSPSRTASYDSDPDTIRIE
jgi:hypothetical protein